MKKIYLTYPKVIGTIHPEIYGHFTEHIGGVFYDGLWVGRDSSIPNERGFRKEILDKLRHIHAPVLRWPGGCYAEIYNWRDGVGPDRPTRINWWTNHDGRYESNVVGTHEFMDLCELVGAKAYFAANLTSVPPLHIRDWMDYCLSPQGATTLAIEREKNGHPAPFDIPFWGVGNENWGGGGNMRPGYYADEYRRYAEIMHNTAQNAELYACGSNGTGYAWTHGVMENLATQHKNHKNVHGFAMHYYCGHAGDPLTFTDEEWTQQLEKAQMMEEIITRNWHIICAHGMQDRVKLIVDEWGCWHPDGSGPSKGYNLFEQQSTLRDAMVAALTLNIFNRHCDKVRMANVAQLVNNLHCLFLAHENDCIVTPTYHIFDMYKYHQGARAIDTVVTDNDDFASSISVSASCKDGQTLVTIANLSCTQDVEISLESVGVQLPRTGSLRILAHADLHAHNTFDAPDTVQVTDTFFDPARPVLIPRGGVAALRFGGSI